MAANYAGTRGTYKVHIINQRNVVNMHFNDVILPVLTSRHTQREQTIATGFHGTVECQKFYWLAWLRSGTAHMDYSHFCITRIELEKWLSQCRCASWLPEMHTEVQKDVWLEPELRGLLLFMNTDKQIGWLIFINCTVRCCCKHSLNHCAGYTARYGGGPGVRIFANISRSSQTFRRECFML